MKKGVAVILCVSIMAWFSMSFAVCGDGGSGSGGSGSGGASAGGASAGGSSGGASSGGGSGGAGSGGAGASSDGSGGAGVINDLGDRKARYFPECDSFQNFLAGKCG